MSRIITEESNKKLRLEYRMRFLIVAFFMFAGVIFINIFLVSSSYLLLTLYQKAYTTESSSKINEEMSKMNDQYDLKINQVHALSQKIPSQTGVTKINIVNLLFEYAREGINIQAIEVNSIEGNPRVTLRGTSMTRDILLQFQNNIKQNPSFKDFNLPIESLTKQKDNSFNVTFTYYEN